MPQVTKYIISRRCDEAMKRSKGECYTPNDTRWRCLNDCANCICGMYQTQEGDWHHNNLMSNAQLKEK